MWCNDFFSYYVRKPRQRVYQPQYFVYEVSVSSINRKEKKTDDLPGRKERYIPEANEKVRYPFYMCVRKRYLFRSQCQTRYLRSTLD